MINMSTVPHSPGCDKSKSNKSKETSSEGIKPAMRVSYATSGESDISTKSLMMDSRDGVFDLSSDLGTISLTIRRRQRSMGVPIERQYALNNQGLTVFNKFYKNKMWLICYEIGRTFVETALFEIPKHGYYHTDRHKNERLQNSFDALRVADLLIKISKQIPVQEKLNITPKYSTLTTKESEAQHLNDTAVRMADPETLSNYKQIRAEILQQADQDDYDADAQQAFTELCHCGFFPADPPVALNARVQPSWNRCDSSSSSITLGFSNIYPSLDDVSQTISEECGEGDNFGLPTTTFGRQRSDIFPVKIMQQHLWEDWQALKNEGKIILAFMSTYQGRKPTSTNGCTVIAPLLVWHHLFSDGHGIADATIDEVIDNEAATVLPQVRSQLGLTQDALIIPSDVHDYMIREGYFNQDLFACVCGGNITSDEDIKKIHVSLDGEKKRKGEKVAAALFFHGHVIAILKTNFTDGRSSYDVIDSFPSALTITGTKEEAGWNKCATRITCKDTESFLTTLKWYAFSRFTDGDIEYIASYEWDDNYATFDPRVFQLFVWANA